MLFPWILLALAGFVFAVFLLRALRCPIRPARRRRRFEPPEPTGFTTPKPQWVRDEVLRLKALMPGNGCRKIAVTFNHMHRRRGMTVGKSFVASVLKRQGYRLAQIRRQIRQRKPRVMPKNVIWALDLTYTGERAGSHTVLGLIDHGTRACLALRNLPAKGSITILRALLDVIERFGKPKVLRTDNEPVLTSWLFRLGLRMLGIRHQRTAPFAPWQNGRIERFFGTFKALIREWKVDAHKLQEDLDRFRFWYNHIRPHQNLGGLTPAHCWDRTTPSARKPPRYFSEWDGLLTGFYFPS